MPSPVLLSIGPFSLRWYGLFAALALLTAYGMLLWRVKKSPLQPDDLTTLLSLATVAGLVGARLEYVRRFWDVCYSQEPWAVFRIWEGGLVFQGGFLLAFLAVCLLCRFRKWSIPAVGDLMAPALAAGHAVARLGCLLNGCCFGIPWNHACGISYPAMGNDVLATQIFLKELPPDAASPLPVLPIQGLEAIWCLLVAGAILFCEKRAWLTGKRFVLYLLAYSLGRFVLEFWRGDYHQATGLTPAQWTTLLVVLPLAALFLLFSCLPLHKPMDSAPSGKRR